VEVEDVLIDLFGISFQIIKETSSGGSSGSLQSFSKLPMEMR